MTANFGICTQCKQVELLEEQNRLIKKNSTEASSGTDESPDETIYNFFVLGLIGIAAFSAWSISVRLIGFDSPAARAITLAVGAVAAYQAYKIRQPAYKLLVLALQLAVLLAVASVILFILYKIIFN